MPLEVLIDEAALSARIAALAREIRAAYPPDVPIHLKERSSGPDGMAPFVRRVVEGTVLARAGA